MAGAEIASFKSQVQVFWATLSHKHSTIYPVLNYKTTFTLTICVGYLNIPSTPTSLPDLLLALSALALPEVCEFPASIYDSFIEAGSQIAGLIIAFVLSMCGFWATSL